MYKHYVQWNVQTLGTMKCTNITYSEMYKHYVQWNVQTLFTVKFTNIAYSEMYKHYVQWNVQTLCTISLYAMFVNFTVNNVCTFHCT